RHRPGGHGAISALAPRSACCGNSAGFTRTHLSGAEIAHVSRQGQKRYLSVHGGCAVTPGHAGLQAQVATVQWRTDSPGIYEGPALRLHQRGTEAFWFTL